MKVIGKIANRYPRYTSDKIIKRIGKKDIVSFDIFDTLIKRTLPSPDSLFFNVAEQFNRVVSNKIDSEKFRIDRIQAEKLVRERAYEKNKEEIILSDIYSQLKEFYEDADILMQIEIDEEMKCCIPNGLMARVYEWCVQQKKRIFIISDMYLPENVIINMLQKCGYENYERLFLSSSVGVQKRNGKLFERFLREMALNPKQVVHVGDNNKVDYLQAKKNGMGAIKIARYPQLTRYSNVRKIACNEKEEYKEMLRFMNCCIDPSWNKYIAYGFEAMGPLIYGYVTFLHEYAIKNSVDKIFFMARDGYIIHKVYNLLYGKGAFANEYFYVSRRSIGRAMLGQVSTFESFINIHNSRRMWTCKTICYRFGVDYSLGCEKWKEYGLDETKEYRALELANDRRAIQFYEYVKSVYDEQIQEEHEQFVAYLNEVGFSGNVLLVDTGGTCTSQKCLEKFGDQNLKIRGLYLWYGGENKPSVQADYYPYEKLPKNLWQTEMIEFSMTSLEGSTLSYKNVNGKVEPVFEVFEYDEDYEMQKIIQDIQEGIVIFCEYFSRWKKMGLISETISGYNAWRVGCFPSYKEVKMLSDIVFYNDNIGTPLCKTKSLFYYLFRLSQLKKDYKNAYWKMGFIKGMFRLPFPYYTWLCFLKKLRK